MAARGANPILNQQMAAIYADLDTIAEQGHYSVSRHD
jgi:hypothetical protein